MLIDIAKAFITVLAGHLLLHLPIPIFNDSLLVLICRPLQCEQCRNELIAAVVVVKTTDITGRQEQVAESYAELFICAYSYCEHPSQR